MIYSHSRLSYFEQCPLKFKYRYLDKIVPEIEETIEAFLGRVVHEALEWMYKELIAGKAPEMDDLVFRYVKIWHEKHNVDIAIARQDRDVNYYFNLGIKFLIGYYQENKPFADKTLDVEKQIIVDLKEDGNYMVQGVVDRIVYDPENGIYEIHDYKTGGTLKSQEEADSDRQLAIYSMGLKNLYENVPGVEKINLVWHYLAFGKKILSKRTEEQAKKLRDNTVELIDKIEKEEEFKPNKSALCGWCEYRPMCPMFRSLHSQTKIADF